VYHNDPVEHTVIEFQSKLKAVNGDFELREDSEYAGMHYFAAQDVAENKTANYIFHTDNTDPKNTPTHPVIL